MTIQVFVSYAHGFGFGSGVLDLAQPVRSMADVHAMAADIVRSNPHLRQSPVVLFWQELPPAEATQPAAALGAPGGGGR